VLTVAARLDGAGMEKIRRNTAEHIVALQAALGVAAAR